MSHLISNSKKYAAFAVASLGFASASDAAVVHFNPVDTPITSTGGGTTTLNFDINSDSVNDYQLEVATGNFLFGDYGTARLNSLGSNALAVSGGDPVAFNLNDIVGPGSTYNNSDTLLIGDWKTDGGNWQNDLNNPRYAGLRFDAYGNTHYGWAKIGTQVNAGVPTATAVLYEAAFESTPNTAIQISSVPEPTSLAMFAMGAAGLAAFRMRRRKS